MVGVKKERSNEECETRSQLSKFSIDMMFVDFTISVAVCPSIIEPINSGDGDAV